MPMTPLPPRRCARKALTAVRLINPRSEEHTSELQSQSNLVCRLLLEKKKKKQISRSRTTAQCELWPAAPELVPPQTQATSNFLHLHIQPLRSLLRCDRALLSSYP